jgi:hypothetical protein
LKNLTTQPFRQTKHVYGPVHGRLRRLDRIVLIMNWRGRAGKIVDLVDLDEQREANVVPHELEPRFAQKVLDVHLRACEEIIQAKHLMPIREQAVDQVRAKEAGTASDKNAFSY